MLMQRPDAKHRCCDVLVKIPHHRLGLAVAKVGPTGLLVLVLTPLADLDEPIDLCRDGGVVAAGSSDAVLRKGGNG